MSSKRIKEYLIISMIVFFSWAGVVNATDIIINEFVSSPNSGESEWIELLNTTDNSVSLTGWKIYDLATPGGTGQHEVLNKELDNLTISAKGIITIDVSNLNNGGDSIGLYNGGILADRVTYGTESTVNGYSIKLTAPSIGKSGALISGSWETNQEPTKNSTNPGSNTSTETTEDTTTTTESSSTTSSSGSGSSNSKEDNIPRKVTAKIIVPKTVFAEIPFTVGSSITTNRKETLLVGKLKWNFGDGMAKEISNSNEFEYTYFYPGDYVISLQYCEHSSCFEIDSTDEVNIKVVPSEIIISSIGNISDAFVEIENKSNYEIILSGWTITAGIYHFKIPDGTTILAKKKIKFSPRITGFTYNDLKNIIITNSQGEVMSSYPQIKTYYPKFTTFQKTESVSEEKIDENSSVINLNELEASVGKSTNNISSDYAYLGLVGVIVIGLISVVLLRKRKDNFDDLESQIRAEDMTIIE